MATRDARLTLRLEASDLAPVDALARAYALPRSDVIRRALALGVERLRLRGIAPANQSGAPS